jgi:hypothetical protein
MAGPKVFECPSCGSPLSTTGDETEVHCAYCGRTIIVPQELRNRPSVPPPSAPAPAATPEQILGERLAEVILARETQGRIPPPPPPRRRRSGCGCSGLLVVGLVVMAVLISQVSSPKAANRTIATLAGSVGLKVTATPVPVSRPLSAGLPRTGQYANLDFTVTKANISNQMPGRGSQAPRFAADKAYAYISTHIKNSLPDKSIYLTDGELHLELADGNQYADINDWADNIDRQSAKDVDFAFQVPPNATWQGARLIFGTSKNEQTALPLDGVAPTPQYPVKLAAPPPANVQGIIYAVTAARLDLDYDGVRVDAGKRYLLLDMKVNNQSSSGIAIAIGPNNFRAIAGDTPLAPLDAPIEAVPANSAVEGRVAFVVPADVQRIDLQLGEVGKNTARLPLTIKR